MVLLEITVSPPASLWNTSGTTCWVLKTRLALSQPANSLDQLRQNESPLCCITKLLRDKYLTSGHICNGKDEAIFIAPGEFNSK